MTTATHDGILQIDNLSVEFSTDQGSLRAVDGVSLTLRKGKTLGIVGESGCGKSVTAMSIMRLLPEPKARYVAGRIIFDGQDLLQASDKHMRGIRGKRIAMVFQDPMSALNPVFTIGSQVAEALLIHDKVTKKAAEDAAISMLGRVGIPFPKERYDAYPHQLSGGMRQRVMIAMALMCSPAVLIADEPTTALDVTIQAQILELLKTLQAQMGMSIILITHDLGVVAETCDDVAVMYAGRVVEHCDAQTLFSKPRHPYTHGLFASLPSLQPKGGRLVTIPGIVPNLLHLPQGCTFQDRCPYMTDQCQAKEPMIEAIEENHVVRCIHPVSGASHA